MEYLKLIAGVAGAVLVALWLGGVLYATPEERMTVHARQSQIDREVDCLDRHQGETNAEKLCNY